MADLISETDDDFVQIVDPRTITPDLLALVGLGQLAYVKVEDFVGRKNTCSIYGADGTLLGHAKNLHDARVAAFQNELETVSLH